MNELIVDEIEIKKSTPDEKSTRIEFCIWMIGNIYNEEDHKLCEKRFGELSIMGFKILRNNKYGNFPLIESIKELSNKESNKFCRIMIMHYHDEIANMEKFVRLSSQTNRNFISKPIFRDGTDDEYCLSGLITWHSVIIEFLKTLKPADHGYLRWMNLIEHVRDQAFGKTVQFVYYNHCERDEEIETSKAQELTKYYQSRKTTADIIILQKQQDVDTLMRRLGFEYCVADDQKRKSMDPTINKLRESYIAIQKYLK